MQLTKQHYEEIAKILNQYIMDYTILNHHNKYIDYSNGATEDIVSRLSDYFYSNNTRFDRKKFRRACGLE